MKINKTKIGQKINRRGTKAAGVLGLTLAFGLVGGIGLPAAPARAAASWTTGNSTATGDQDNVAIASSRTGYTAIVWEDDRDSTPTDSVGSDVWVRLFHNGEPKFEKKVSAGGTAGKKWRHIQPDVGVDDLGRVVVVWADDPDGNGYYNIPIRIFDAAGKLLHSARANESSDGQQTKPSVAVDPDGSPPPGAGEKSDPYNLEVSYAVAWEDRQGEAKPRIAMSRFVNATRRFEKVVSPTAGTNRNPDLAITAGATTTLVWEEDADANGTYNIGLTRLDKSANVVLKRTVANADVAGQQLAPAVAATFDGAFAVTWQGDKHIAWRGFTSTGKAVTGDVAVQTGEVTQPSIGIDGQSNVVVTWTTAGVDTFAQGFAADGTSTGRLPRQQLSSNTEGRQEGLVPAVNANGEVAVALTDDADGNSQDQIHLGFGLTTTTW
ncbi:hypothetical protein ACQCX2_15550 [Propionibacteriaceae bacterium Y1700]|uniref:hypothetical protein n=1 Tax=Microlunatus sp. Y1700 TaxID=3418487 RepID=UPI003DA72414